MQPLLRDWIAAHIPHRGSMCLLDEVLSWDDEGVRCRSSSHRRDDNPLRAHGKLGAACGIEYAAQAMAVHGALIASRSGDRAAPGMLASVRNVQLLVERLDDITADLIAAVHRLAGDAASALYEFDLVAQGSHPRTLLQGRAAIAFNIPGQLVTV
jgi:predicted hotdog family 3-hydroxylacyl-ACP dehydratase